MTRIKYTTKTGAKKTNNNNHMRYDSVCLISGRGCCCSCFNAINISNSLESAKKIIIFPNLFSFHDCHLQQFSAVDKR